jgi:hypothetical protein
VVLPCQRDEPPYIPGQVAEGSHEMWHACMPFSKGGASLLPEEVRLRQPRGRQARARCPVPE